MARVMLIHWNEAEAEVRADRLRCNGRDVAWVADADAVRGLVAEPPDAFVVDLSRAPSRGRDVGVWLRSRKASRLVPLVFVGGESAGVETVRSRLPDAFFTSWDEIEVALGGALSRQVVEPLVPGVMDAYSGRPLAQKLGIREGSSVFLVDAPDDFERCLVGLPGTVSVQRGQSGSGTVVILFARSLHALVARLDTALEALDTPGRLWIAWPKKASRVASDLKQAEVRRRGMAAGLVDYKVCSIDATWAGLCFARRAARRRR